MVFAIYLVHYPDETALEFAINDLIGNKASHTIAELIQLLSQEPATELLYKQFITTTDYFEASNGTSRLLYTRTERTLDDLYAVTNSILADLQSLYPELFI